MTAAGPKRPFSVTQLSNYLLISHIINNLGKAQLDGLAHADFAGAKLFIDGL
jgi:hypothetical protein